MNNKKLIKEVLKNLEKSKQLKIKADERNQLIKSIAETTGCKEYEVKLALQEVEYYREHLTVVITFFSFCILVIVLTIIFS